MITKGKERKHLFPFFCIARGDGGGVGNGVNERQIFC